MRKDQRVLANLCMAMVVVTMVFTILATIEVQSTVLTFLGVLMTIFFTLPIITLINTKNQ